MRLELATIAAACAAAFLIACYGYSAWHVILAEVN